MLPNQSMSVVNLVCDVIFLVQCVTLLFCIYVNNSSTGAASGFLQIPRND
jgi:hypothetical protein